MARHSKADLERFNEEYRGAVSRMTDAVLASDLGIENNTLKRGFNTEGRRFRIGVMNEEVARRRFTTCPTCGAAMRAEEAKP